MPKKSKRNKDRIADFSRAKLKLGKGKKAANNAINTSFKARSIAIPSQSIGLERNASKPTTHKNLALEDLLVHLKHYNSNIKKDAMMGLRELLEAYPKLVETSLLPIIQTCARCVGDEDAEVRRVLLEFLSWLLRLTPPDQIQPHTPLLLLFITSAQTHIFPAIRIDAVRFLDLLLELTPEIVTTDWNEPGSTGSRALEGYLGLLSVSAGFGTTQKDDVSIASTSSVTLSQSSKLVVLSSLATFLRTAISPSALQQDGTMPTWYMASGFSTYTEFFAFCSLIQPMAVTGLDEKEVQWSKGPQGVDFEDFAGNFSFEWDIALDSGFSLEELQDINQTIAALKSNLSGASASHSKSLCITRLARALQPLLLSTWLDVAPTLFGVSSLAIKTESQLALSVSHIAGCLYGAIFRNLNVPTDIRAAAFADLTALLGYMSTHLPYVSEKNDIQLEQLLSSLNVAYCELTSLAVMESQHITEVPFLKAHPPFKPKQRKALSIQLERVGDYVVRAIDGEQRSSLYPLGYSLTASSYTALLPTIWSLIKYQCTHGGDPTNKRICTLIIAHATNTSSRASLKRAATQFVGMLVLCAKLNSCSQASLAFRLEFTPNEYELLKQWYIQLPKVMWEVGAKDPLLTETILRLLLRVGQRRPAILDSNTMASVRSRLVPYFATTHPQKGEILGPFTKLQQRPLRRLTLDVAFTLLQDAPAFEDVGLKAAVDKAVNGTMDANYWSTMAYSVPYLKASKK